MAMLQQFTNAGSDGYIVLNFLRMPLPARKNAEVTVHNISFPFANPPASYDEAKAALDTHCKPAQNLPYQRHLFQQTKQTEGGSISQYVTRLQQLAKTVVLDKTQITLSETKLLTNVHQNNLEPNCWHKRFWLLQYVWTLLPLRKHRRNRRLTHKKRFLSITGSTSDSRPSHCNYSDQHFANHNSAEQSQHSSQSPSVQCSHCGAKGHTGLECHCSQNVTCNKCNKLGHFTSVYRSNPKQHSDNQQWGKPVRFVADNFTEKANDTGSSDDDYVFTLTPRDGTYKVFIEEEPVSVVIDSGATCNIINS